MNAMFNQYSLFSTRTHQLFLANSSFLLYRPLPMIEQAELYRLIVAQLRHDGYEVSVSAMTHQTH